MSGSKKNISIIVNGGAPKRCKHYAFDYGQTKGIQLLLGPVSATVNLRMATGKDAAAFASPDYPYYVNCLQKVMLAWSIAYGRFGKIEKATVKVDGKLPSEAVCVFGEGNGPFLQSISAGTRVKMASEWSNSVVANNVLGVAKTSASHREASLVALVLAKAKGFPANTVELSEKFTYAWMAMNGYYGALASMASRFLPKKKADKLKRNDTERIALCLRYHGYGNCSINANDAPRFARKAVAALREAPDASEALKIQDGEVMSAFAAELHDFQKRKDGNGELYNPYSALTLNGYFVFCLPYYFRCSLLHAERPVALYVHSSDERYWCLSQLCGFIEAFLDEHLWKLFDEAYVASVALPRLEKLVGSNE